MSNQFLVKSRHYEKGFATGDIGEQIVKAKTPAQAREKVLRCGTRTVIETPTPFSYSGNDYSDFLRRIRQRKEARLAHRQNKDYRVNQMS